jgi:uncharacterized membrane protein SpoIIM required for sporulation
MQPAIRPVHPPAHGTELNSFLARRRPHWRRLEVLLEQAEREGLKALSTPEVREFGTLYRRTSSDLVTARSRTANAEVLAYLNDLVARAYAQVYRSRRFHLRDAVTFLLVDYPRLVRHCWKYVALAAALFTLGFGFGWEMNRRDPAGAFYTLPPTFARSIPEMRRRWAGNTGHHFGPDMMAAMSSMIMANNIAVGFSAFASGILLGVGPLYAMLQNGMMLGILGEAMSRPQTALTFWSLILPHGILELAAIMIMGGAGFMVGGALLAPGRRSRRDALVERGRLAVLLALGGAAILVVAGLIEGFITPPAFIPPAAKLIFAALSLAALAAYVGLAGRGPQPGLLRELAGYQEPRERLPVL